MNIHEIIEIVQWVIFTAIGYQLLDHYLGAALGAVQSAVDLERSERREDVERLRSDERDLIDRVHQSEQSLVILTMRLDQAEKDAEEDDA